MPTPENPAITPADQSRSGYIEIDYGLLRKQALEEVSKIILVQIGQRFKRLKQGITKMNVRQQGRKDDRVTYLITITQGKTWLRYRINILVDKADAEDWAAQIEVEFDDAKNLLLPRSKIKLKSKTSRLYKYDFARIFNERFKEILSFFQALVQLDWTKVSLLDLARSTIENFLKKQGIKI